MAFSPSKYGDGARLALYDSDTLIGMAMGSRVPAIIRVVQVLGVLQAIGMIAASIGVIVDTLSTDTTQSAGQQPLTLGHLAVVLIGITLVGGLILRQPSCCPGAQQALSWCS